MTGASSTCGACKFLRRKCTSECVFVPYFSYDEAATHFAAVHKVFGASNVSKLLMHIPAHYRIEAAYTISYEALARVTDPVFGCVSQIYNLHQQIAKLQEEIEVLGNQMTLCSSQQEMGVEQVTYMMKDTTGGYGDVAEDQSFVTDHHHHQLFPVTGVDVNSYNGQCMEMMNEGLVEQEAGQVFCPVLDESHRLVSYQSEQEQRQHWAGATQF